MSNPDRELWAAIYKALKQVQAALGLVMAAIAARWQLDGAGNPRPMQAAPAGVSEFRG
jgi:hypothetical protein